jgi:NAD(P)H-dependent FMN reductase
MLRVKMIAMRILAISGSVRRGSTNRKLLDRLAALAPASVTFDFFESLDALPHFNPDLDEEGMVQPSAVQDLRSRVAVADAVVISSPEYAHGVPGSLKNALDWLVSAGELVSKPVVLLNAAPQGGEFAQRALAETLVTMNWNLLPSRMEPFVLRKGEFATALVDEVLLDVLKGIHHRGTESTE